MTCEKLTLKAIWIEEGRESFGLDFQHSITGYKSLFTQCLPPQIQWYTLPHRCLLECSFHLSFCLILNWNWNEFN